MTKYYKISKRILPKLHKLHVVFKNFLYIIRLTITIINVYHLIVRQVDKK